MNRAGSQFPAANPAYNARNSTAETSSMTTSIQEYTSKVEDVLDTASEPIKPYLPAIGRFLIVVTFLEDALRIVTQWKDQVYFLSFYRGIPSFITYIFLMANVVIMTVMSVLVISRKHTEIAVGGLFGVQVLQGIAYGMMLDLVFIFRNLSIAGGLLMVLSDSLTKRKQLFAGLPSMDAEDRRQYFQLAGRVLLICLFIGFVFTGQWSLSRILVSILGFFACVMVVVGFKAKWSAILLVVILSIFNLFINNFWSFASHEPERDFLKYDFFQTLSILGGLLLLVNMGPGDLSMDEKKKIY